MAFFNHTIEYETDHSEDILSGDIFNLRKAKVEYDDFWGRRCARTLVGPIDLWTNVKIGGTASTGGMPKPSVVTRDLGSKCQVWDQDSREAICQILPVLDLVRVGDRGFIFEHMRHDRGSYGVFEKCFTRQMPQHATPGLHSINFIIMNNDEEVGVIRVDPYIEGMLNFDGFTLAERGVFYVI